MSPKVLRTNSENFGAMYRESVVIARLTWLASALHLCRSENAFRECSK